MYLTIDIGATKTLIALFSRRGRVVRRLKFPTSQGYKTFLATLTTNLRPFTRYRVQALVVAVPGIVQKNYTVNFGNRNWGDFDLLTPIKNLFTCPICFENDANLAALYEAADLPGRTVFLTFSTGIGGGVVENDILLERHFEPGHETYVYQGKTAEWEDLASARAIGHFYHVDHATDLRSQAALQDIAARLYLGLPDIVKRFHPDTIIIGGPLGKNFRLFAKYLPVLPGVTYKRPKRPQESVIYGAYLYARRQEGLPR